MDRMATSMIQMRQNLSTMNVTQNPNTTLNFVKCTFSFSQYKGN